MHIVDRARHGERPAPIVMPLQIDNMQTVNKNKGTIVQIFYFVIIYINRVAFLSRQTAIFVLGQFCDFVPRLASDARCRGVIHSCVDVFDKSSGRRSRHNVKG